MPSYHRRALRRRRAAAARTDARAGPCARAGRRCGRRPRTQLWRQTSSRRRASRWVAAAAWSWTRARAPPAALPGPLPSARPCLRH
eukprot:123309-Chlamydomonas_euryale.AAC.6